MGCTPGTFPIFPRSSLVRKSVNVPAPVFYFNSRSRLAEETTLRLLPSQGQRLLIRSAGLRRASQPATQIVTGGVREVIIGEFVFLARQQAILAAPSE